MNERNSIKEQKNNLILLFLRVDALVSRVYIRLIFPVYQMHHCLHSQSSLPTTPQKNHQKLESAVVQYHSRLHFVHSTHHHLHCHLNGRRHHQVWRMNYPSCLNLSWKTSTKLAVFSRGAKQTTNKKTYSLLNPLTTNVGSHHCPKDCRPMMAQWL